MSWFVAIIVENSVVHRLAYVQLINLTCQLHAVYFCLID